MKSKDELINEIIELENKFSHIKKVSNLEKLETNIKILEKKTLNENFWDDSQTAQKLSMELADNKNFFNTINDTQNELKDLRELVNFYSETEANDIEIELQKLTDTVNNIEIDTLLNGEYDNRNSIWTLRSGEGGTEAADWTKMLFRMYEKYLTKNNYKISILDTSFEEHGGIKSRIFKVNGPFAYGKFKNEAGTHRLVRISPFDSNKRRHTSFAGLEIIPEINSTDTVEIPENELKIDIFRSSGPGGQSVNTTDSAVRITHIPTGIVVSMQNERSQIQNKANATNILKSKLLKLQKEKESFEKKHLAGDVKATWGDQVRNYILNPFQLVKDTRTKVETSDATGVLNGDLDKFIKAEIEL